MPFFGQDRVLGAALGISIAVHAVLMAVHFKLPDSLRWKSQSQPLEVVLVNAKTRERPSRAELLAQSNLDRGGNVDERRRARTPLPVTEPKNPGKDLAAAQRRAQKLEVQQREMLTQAQAQSRVPKSNERPAPSPGPGCRCPITPGGYRSPIDRTRWRCWRSRTRPGSRTWSRSGTAG